MRMPGMAGSAFHIGFKSEYPRVAALLSAKPFNEYVIPFDMKTTA